VDRELSTDPREMHVCALGRSMEFNRSVDTSSRLFRCLKVPVSYRAPDGQCTVLNAKSDADLFGSYHVIVLATLPLVKLARILQPTNVNHSFLNINLPSSAMTISLF
jgi:hypothetical protein